MSTHRTVEASATPAPGPRTSSTSSRARNGGNLAAQALHGLLSANGIRVGSPRDAAEHQADRMAEGALRRESCQCSTGSQPCPACHAARSSTLRFKPAATASSQPSANPTWDLGSSRSLNAREQSLFERGYGADLSHVRLHDNPSAAATASSLGARAFSLGSNIAFARGQYRPGTHDGDLLLGHELAHVVQDNPSILRRQEADSSSAPLTCGPEAPNMSVAEPDANPNAELATPAPGPRSIDWGGTVLSPSPAYLRHVLAQVAAASGYAAMESFVANIEFNAAAPSAEPVCTEESGLVQEIATTIRVELGALQAEYRQFSSLVRNAAVVRLRRNHINLGLWRDYVASLTPSAASGIDATMRERSVLMAALHDRRLPFDAMDVYERRSLTTSHWERDFLQRLIVGEIHGGCQHCHESVQARNREFESPTFGAAAIPLARTVPRFATQAAEAPAPQGDIAEPNAPSLLPDWAARSIGDRPGSRAIGDALGRLRDYLMPLGERGYQIISSSTLWNTDEGTLISDTIAAIDNRRAGYLTLIGQIGAEGYDFYELQDILQQLMPFAEADVQAVVEGESRKRQRDREAEANASLVLGAVVFLMTIFPPTAPFGLAAGAALAVSGAISGYRQYEQGRRFEMGRGSDVFTDEQVESASVLQAMGIFTMATSVLDLAVTAAPVASGVWRARSAAGGAEVEFVANRARVRIEGPSTPNPRITITHPNGTVRTLTVDELEALATASRESSAGAHAASAPDSPTTVAAAHPISAARVAAAPVPGDLVFIDTTIVDAIRRGTPGIESQLIAARARGVDLAIPRPVFTELSRGANGEAAREIVSRLGLRIDEGLGIGSRLPSYDRAVEAQIRFEGLSGGRPTGDLVIGAHTQAADAWLWTLDRRSLTPLSQLGVRGISSL
jgi:predicted nucleic acid-binding protein